MFIIIIISIQLLTLFKNYVSIVNCYKISIQNYKQLYIIIYKYYNSIKIIKN